MRRRLHLHLEDKQYRDMIQRYHFRESDLTKLKEIGRITEDAAAPEIFFEAAEEKKGVPVIVTLGIGVDRLQEQYLQEECLTESYMIECVSMALLERAYGHAAECIYAHTGMWMSGISFLGDKIPLGSMEEIFQRLNPQGIVYNQAYMLTPKKTVIFLTDLHAGLGGSVCNVCSGCGNLSCSNRCATSTMPSP